MDLLKLNIFRGSIFKQAKFLVSAPPKACQSLYIGEPGSVSKEVQPTNTGFVSADAVKKAWLVLHPLKRRILKNGQPFQDEAVLPISDRSYFPLDPQNTMSVKDREAIINLKSIAKMRHAQARIDTGRDRDPQANLAQTIVSSSFILLAVIALGAIFIRSCGGG